MNTAGRGRIFLHVFRLNRRDLALAAAVLTLLLFTPLGRVGRSVLVSGLPGQATVRPGVRVGELQLGGRTPAEARAQLEAAKGRWERPPADAVVDPETRGRGVLPELNGLALDVQATLERAMAAPANARLEPVLRAVPAQRTSADYPNLVIYRGNPGKRQVTLAINVAWGDAELLEVLDILDERKVKATFFIAGRWAAKGTSQAPLSEVVRRGHEIASHGYNDAAKMSQLSRAQVAADIGKSRQVIEALTGQKIRYFSPPFGDWGPAVPEVAAEQGLRMVLWTIDTRDWMEPSRDEIVRRVVRGAQAGSIILMHPKPVTVTALGPIIDGLRARGLELVPLGRLLDPNSAPAESD